MAPKAHLMVHRALYPGSVSRVGARGSTTELIRGIEDAVVNGADVVDNSWDSIPLDTPQEDPLAKAVNAGGDGCVWTQGGERGHGEGASLLVGPPDVLPKRLGSNPACATKREGNLRGACPRIFINCDTDTYTSARSTNR